MDVLKREFPARPPKEPLTSLAAIVRDYQWRFPRERRDMVWEFCRTAPNLTAAIKRAVGSRGEDGKMHNHQTRVPESIRQEFGERLLAWRRPMRRIAMGPAVLAFDALHDLCDAARPERGIGPVTLYDVATRIGAYLDVHPTSLYVHAGVREGLYALMEGSSPETFEDRRSWARVERIPEDNLVALWPEFKGLPPDEVEDLLCTYRDCFKDVTW